MSVYSCRFKHRKSKIRIFLQIVTFAISCYSVSPSFSYQGKCSIIPMTCAILCDSEVIDLAPIAMTTNSRDHQSKSLREYTSVIDSRYLLVWTIPACDSRLTTANSRSKNSVQFLSSLSSSISQPLSRLTSLYELWHHSQSSETPETYSNIQDTIPKPLNEATTIKDYESWDFKWVYGSWNGQRALGFTSAALNPVKPGSLQPESDLFTEGVELKIGLEDSQGIQLSRRDYVVKPYAMYLIANLFDVEQESGSTPPGQDTELNIDSDSISIMTDKSRSRKRIIRRPSPYVITSSSPTNMLKDTATSSFVANFNELIEILSKSTNRRNNTDSTNTLSNRQLINATTQNSETLSKQPSSELVIASPLSEAPSLSSSQTQSTSRSLQTSLQPSKYQTVSLSTLKPSAVSSALPSSQAFSTSTDPSTTPSASHSTYPSTPPNLTPSQNPNFCPSITLSNFPTTLPPSKYPSFSQSVLPSIYPSMSLSESPSENPSQHQSFNPTILTLSQSPSSLVSSQTPSISSSFSPTAYPSTIPSNMPTTTTSMPSFPYGAGYQSGSPWPHFRGLLNNNNGRSLQQGTLNNATRWIFPTSGVVTASPVIASDGTIYLGAWDSCLYALNPSGLVSWNFTTGSVIASAAAIGQDGTIYVGTSFGYVFAISPSGLLKWNYLTGSSIISSPSVGSDGTIYVGSSDSYLYALNSTGSRSWRYKVGDISYCTPAISRGGIIYVSSSAGYLYSLSSAGTLIWQLFFSQGGFSSSPALSDNEIIYVGSADTFLYAIGPDGSIQWKAFTAAVSYSSPAIGSDGTIYVGSENHYLYAISSLGTQKWAYPTNGIIRSSPTVGVDGTIYFSSLDGYMYALSQNGTLVWSYLLGQGAVDYGSAAISADGTVYIGTRKNCLYAFSDITLSPTITPTIVPSLNPSSSPSQVPTKSTERPTNIPTAPSQVPSLTPTSPTLSPTHPTANPTVAPGKYQDGSPWPHFRGMTNSNNALSTFIATRNNNTYWIYPTSGSVISSPAVGSDGTVYIADGSNLYAINEDGAYKSRYSAVGTIQSSPAVGSDGTVYVGSNDGCIYAITFLNNIGASNKKWSYCNAYTTTSSPVIGSDSTLYIGAQFLFFALNLLTGSVKWSYGNPSSSAFESTAALGSNGAIYVGSDDNYLYSLVAPGSALWRYYTNNSIKSSPAIGHNGQYIVFGSQDKSIYCLTTTGSLLWSAPTKNSVISSPAISSTGMIYIGSGDTNLYVLYSNGTVNWKFTTYGAIYSSPVLDANNTVYFTSNDAFIYAINQYGTVVWKSKIGSTASAGALCSSPAISFDGTVYIGSASKAIYAFSDRTFYPTVSPSSKPTFLLPTNVPTSMTPMFSFCPTKSPTTISTSSKPPSQEPSVSPSIPTISLIPLIAPSIHPNPSATFNPTPSTTAAAPAYAPSINSRPPSLQPANSVAPTRSSTFATTTPIRIFTKSLAVLQDVTNTSSFSNTIWKQTVLQMLYPYEVLINISSSQSYATSRQLGSSKVVIVEKFIVNYNVLYSGLQVSSNELQNMLVRMVENESFTNSLRQNSVAAQFYGFLNSTVLDPVFITQTPAPSRSANSQSGHSDNLLNTTIVTIIGAFVGAFIVALFSVVMYYCYVVKQYGSDLPQTLSGRSISSQRRTSETSLTRSRRQPSISSFSGSREGRVTRLRHGLSSSFSSSKAGSNGIRDYGTPTGRDDLKSDTKTFRYLTSREESKVFFPDVPIFYWEDLELASSWEDSLIGKGSFGVVVRARFTCQESEALPSSTEDVAVKIVLSNSPRLNSDGTNAEKVLQQATNEVRVMMNAERRIGYKSCIVRAYGIIYGPLPNYICQAINVNEEVRVVGILMQYEAGGTLSAYIHPKPCDSNDPRKTLSFPLKIKLLTEVARGLAELHTAGIVHGDIKPENVLLSGGDPPEARLADFGLSAVRDQNSAFDSTLAETSHFKGTPLYSAPEMVVNPFKDSIDGKLAKASRKTDMYSFGILVWEVLTGELPFAGIKSEILLASRVHQGLRPPIGKLPIECNLSIKNMIMSCWDDNRYRRKSGLECWSILQQVYRKLCLNAQTFASVDDICVYYHPSCQTLAEYIFQRMTQHDFSTRLVCSCSEPDLSPLNGAPPSAHFKTVLIIVNSELQEDKNCLSELRKMKECKMSHAFVPAFIESVEENWISDDISYICKLHSPDTLKFDLVSVCSGWSDFDRPSELLSSGDMVEDPRCPQSGDIAMLNQAVDLAVTQLQLQLLQNGENLPDPYARSGRQ